MAYSFTYDQTNNTFLGVGLPQAGTYTITQDGVVDSTTANVAAMDFLAGPDTVIVNGQVEALIKLTSTNAMVFNPSNPAGTMVSKLTVGTTGVIAGEGDGVKSNHALNISNAGLIFGGGTAIDINGVLAAYTVTNSGHIWSDGLDALDMSGIGNHTLNNSGLIDGFIVSLTTAANDTITNSGTINGDLALSDGINKVTNSHILAGSINSGVGNDVFSNTGHILGGISDSGGNNSLTNKGYIDSSTTFQAGSNTLTNSGIMGNLTGGTGIEKLTNSGTIALVDLKDGDNTISNSGTIAQVSTGTGNDIFTNNGTVNSIISLGIGADKFTGGSHPDSIYDDGGKDTYNLGGGNDHFYAVHGASNDSVDTVDGGSNTTDFVNDIFGDIYDASNATNFLLINLDNVGHKVGSTPLAANTAFSADVGTDIIKNFEEVIGGSAGDVIWGNGSANRLDGGAGSDDLFGGAGNDELIGGTGTDLLQGGLGADQLWGGLYHNSGDGSPDYFSYHALTDSTVATAGRDTIHGFDDGTDLVTFYTGMGLGSAVFAGTDVAFTGSHGTNGEVRVLTIVGGWTIQIDTNGDKKADMAIDVSDFAHNIHWDGSDFFFHLSI